MDHIRGAARESLRRCRIVRLVSPAFYACSSACRLIAYIQAVFENLADKRLCFEHMRFVLSTRGPSIVLCVVPIARRLQHADVTTAVSRAFIDYRLATVYLDMKKHEDAMLYVQRALRCVCARAQGWGS